MRRVDLLLLAGASIAFGVAMACTGEDPDLGRGTIVDGGGDANAGDASGADSSFDAGPRCNPTAAFQTPTPLEGVGTPDHELSASLSEDELTMYFSRRGLDPSANSELYVATRTSRDGTFGSSTLLAVVNSAYEDDNVATTGDALTIFFQSTRHDGGLAQPDIFRAARPSFMAGFSTPAPVAINSAEIDGDPFIMADGKTLYFTSTRSGQLRIYRSAQTANGEFESALEMSELHTVEAGQREIRRPVLTPDGKTLYFASGDSSNVDVWVATRTDTLLPFSDLRPVENVSLPSANDVPAWASSDGCRLVFRSNRPGGAGGEDLWLAKRGF